LDQDKSKTEFGEVESTLTRREALKAAGTGLLLLLPMFSAVANANTDAPPTTEWTIAGKSAQFPLGQPQRTPLAGGDILYITRLTSKTLVAVSARCTHRGCEIGWDKPSSQFICPCHGAAFATSGKNIHGTKRQPEETLPPLPTVPVVEKKGQVLVNLKAVPAPSLIPGH